MSILPTSSVYLFRVKVISVPFLDLKLSLVFSNFFGWGPKKLSEKSRNPQKILLPSKCVNTKLLTLIFHLFVVFYTKFIFFSNLATLKRVTTPSLRTTELSLILFWRKKRSRKVVIKMLAKLTLS